MRPVETAAVGVSQIAEIQPDGTFTFTNCDPASYAVRFFPPSGTYIKAILFNNQDVNTQLMDLSRGTGGQMTLVVRPNPAHSKDGRFTATGIPPGRYTALATTAIDIHLWEIATFVREMQSRGVGIDLAESDQKQVAVPYLSLADVDQIQSRLGIN